ncbi:AAA family ATPase [Massilia timonae]|uniref:ABC transporter family protein n=1 Tax=Massilia timonae TaxID=47229 RepID=A0A1S2NIC2_9BURK|nr:AAA family ATPase [Massilia timonae]OIJ44474.1 ABC transporter family protein [Massilia timonae]
MRIEQLELENIGPFRSLSMPLAPTADVRSNVTVLIGDNGAGKTTVLKSLATSLSWFVGRLRSGKSTGNSILEEQIRNGANSAAIKISTTDETDRFEWTLVKTRAGRKGEHSSQLSQVVHLADVYRTALTIYDQSNLPLIAFYPVERVVLDIPLKIREKHTFQQLDGYDNSLNQGVDFRRFFEWFREREDSENEQSIPPEKLDQIDLIFGARPELRAALQKLEDASRDRQLSAVRTAIAAFMPGFGNLRVRRKPKLYMSIDKGEQSLNVSQLSQGEKSLMALVGDIARRLAMMNPDLPDPLKGRGLILIDEVDMHLHPRWARDIIARLTTTFPNCQFVLSTHSPLVISDSKDVLVYALDDGHLTRVPSLYGQDANTVLLEVMDTHIRNASVATRLNDLLDLIQDNRLEEARQVIGTLESELPPQHLDLARARVLLRKQEMRVAKD